jgi:hypothetical protein
MQINYPVRVVNKRRRELVARGPNRLPTFGSLAVPTSRPCDPRRDGVVNIPSNG